MATLAELKRQRLASLRSVRRIQRAADTAIEKIERRLSSLSNRKTIIDAEAALTLVPLYNDFRDKVRTMEKALADFISVVRI